ncbi:IS200/IS605 family transposase [uncultured Algoriphagus sp.]|uniref:IS200/IS605 family transposase n=1 Tax=uncultured Algoriphagus sp. TaxID=417365 RepID=UPI0030EF57A7|tara:strand:+ start:509 stop:970 length:462 start_codon:yes stop_codon:yes gene_type:complete
MANTYSQIHIHFVFATQFRNALISEIWEKRLYEYMIAIIHNYGHKVLAINGMPDHVHILTGHRPEQGVSELVQIVKSSTSKWINEEKLTSSKFAWQAGFGAFSYAKSDLPKVINYINNQKDHHKKSSFKQEYLKILNGFEVDYNPEYIFKEPE